MARQRETRNVGPGRMAGPESPGAAIQFEWMSFSGRMRLTGADGVLCPGAAFFGALVGDAERARVRSALEAAAETGAPVSLACRLATRSGARTFLLKGEVVRGEGALAPRVRGVLLEEGSPSELELDGLVRMLAGTLGDEAEGAAPSRSPAGVGRDQEAAA